MAKDLFRSAARKRQTLFNAWLMMNNPLAIELIGDAGWDCVTIDQQHGAGGNETMLSCLTAAKAAGLPAIVRVANNDPGLVGRALDAGAQGVMCPLIENVAEAESFVQAVKYPPRGNRSWGPYRAKIGATGDYFKTANRFTIACPQIRDLGQPSPILDAILARLRGRGHGLLRAQRSSGLTGSIDIWAKSWRSRRRNLAKAREKAS